MVETVDLCRESLSPHFVRGHSDAGLEAAQRCGIKLLFNGSEDAQLARAVLFDKLRECFALEFVEYDRSGSHVMHTFLSLLK